MIISEKTHQRLFNLFLLLIATTMIFRQICTVTIIVFSIYNLVFYKTLTYSHFSKKLILIIAIPLILEIVFFWNNNSAILGLKTLEKNLSLLVFPLFILGNYSKINYIKLLRYYSLITTLIVFFFFIRFIVVYPDYMDKYLNGIHLWETGYVFSTTIGMHAPAINMHMAFVAISNLYFFLNYELYKSIYIGKALSLVTFLTSFFLVLFINTRVSLLCMLLGFIIILYYQFLKKKHFHLHLKRSLIIIVSSIAIFIVFIKKDTFIKEKFTTQIFSNIDKIGKLDEIKNPETVVYSSLVTRLSIWKSCWELSLQNLPFGVGSADGRGDLIQYFKDTNQKFLAKYEFATHNQYLDFLLKYGFLGFIGAVFYIGYIGYLGLKFRNPLILSFFFLFFISNLTDDFLIRFDGIAFSGFWFSIFAAFSLQKAHQLFYNEIENDTISDLNTHDLK